MKDISQLVITYCNPQDHQDSFSLNFNLRNNSVVPKWTKLVNIAQSKFKIDDTTRFYGFGPKELQHAQALESINKCIDIINDFEPIIERKLDKIDDQDTLNYLHHIFEVYHGLLGKQTHDFWLRAPADVRLALADLNVLVHRCESVYKGAYPRHVVTWYQLPKSGKLSAEDYQWFEDGAKFGTVYLNYVEIGKTLEDLAHDNDQYIADDAFRPFKHFSADFNVKFWSDSDRHVEENRSIIKAYYDKNKNFFIDRNYIWGSPELAQGYLPLADLDSDIDTDILSAIESRQFVKSVSFK